jgi:hypothetical protein
MLFNFTYGCTGGSQTFVAPGTGNYRISCYGAQGGGRQSSGNSYSGLGGRGGYASGVIYLEKGTILYVYAGCVGGSANDTIATGGFNGGGSAYGSYYGEPANGGGGASDVRLISGPWDNPSGLLSRIIVAGGGGGEDPGDVVGYGGGVTGGQGGSSGSGGEFGKGAHTNYVGGGGGGGWIGGNTAGGSQTIPTSTQGYNAQGGSGGSGYVYTNTSSVYSGYLVVNPYRAEFCTCKFL